MPKIKAKTKIQISKANYAKSPKGIAALKKANQAYDSKRVTKALDGIQPEVKERFITAKMGREISHNDFIVELLDKASGL